VAAVVVLVVIIGVIAAATGSKKKTPVTTATTGGPAITRGTAPQTTTRPTAAATTPAPTTATPATVAAATTAPPATAAPTTTAPPRPPAVTQAAPPIVLSGTGQSTPSFNAAGGLTVLSATYGGSDNFSVEIIDNSGQSVDIPINDIGVYSGTVSESLDAGHYTLNVTASVAWTITVTQPRNQTAASLPYVFNKGRSDALIGPFKAKGAYKITATNTGQENFVVNVLDTKGASQDIPINVIGNYSGSVVESDVSPGNYYLQVNSDGAWSITVSSL